MDMKDEWLSALQEWAKKHESIRELWVFGSRAKGTAKPDSDLDVGIYLMPKEWAMGTYVALVGRKWEKELGAALGATVNIRMVMPGTELDMEVKATGKRLWVRED